MHDTWSRPTSPLLAWFFLMEVLMAAGVVAYWVQVYQGHSPWLHAGFPQIAGTMLFVVANVLLIRHRALGGVLLALSWMLIGCFMLMPTLSR